MSTTDSAERGGDEWELFRYSNDPFVNEGAVQLGRQLAAAGVARIDRRAVVATASPNQVFSKLRAELFGSDGIVTNTHRRTTRAYHVNALATGTLSALEVDDREPDWLGESIDGGGATIPAPTEPFPDSDGDATVFPNDDLSDDELEAVGLSADTIDREGDSAYALHPSYLGVPQSDDFASASEKAKRYLETLEDVYTRDAGDIADITTCMCCGAALPNWKWELDEYDEKNIEYSQGFTPLTTMSGRPTPLGQKASKNSYFGGRCPGCLLAGFYYVCMPTKPIADAADAGVYRIFCIEGDFETIEAVRRAYEQTAGLSDLNAPSSGGTIQTSSFPVRSSISEVQSLAFFGALLRALAADTETDAEALFADSRAEPTELTTSLTGGISLRSSPGKGGNPSRGLSGFQEIPATKGLYERLRERTRDTSSGIESYNPFEDVLAWHVRVRNPNTDTEVGVAAKRDLAQGIIDGNLALLERGVFGLLKHLAGDAEPAYGMSIGRHQHYFDTIMADTATTITDETRNSIKTAGRSVGQMFAERDDLSVLQSFRHANSPDQFLSAIEKAGMGAVKKSHDQDDVAAHSTWIASSTVDDLLGAITDEETFEAAKQMFVVYASLSAHYENSAATNDGDN